MNESEVLIASGKYIKLVKRGKWEFAARTNSSAVVAIIPQTEKELVFIEQYRPPVNARVVEFPAGLVGDTAAFANEGLLEAAGRELEEETGYQAGKLTFLTRGPASAGACTEIIDCFLAEDLQKTGPGGGDSSEDIAVYHVPFDEIDTWLKSREAAGCIIDIKVYTLLYFWLKARTARHPQ